MRLLQRALKNILTTAMASGSTGAPPSTDIEVTMQGDSSSIKRNRTDEEQAIVPFARIGASAHFINPESTPLSTVYRYRYWSAGDPQNTKYDVIHVHFLNNRQVAVWTPSKETCSQAHGHWHRDDNRILLTWEFTGDEKFMWAARYARLENTSVYGRTDHRDPKWYSMLFPITD